MTPALAAVISFIDVRSNIDVVSEPWAQNLWMEMFSRCHELGLTFARLIQETSVHDYTVTI